MANLKTEIILSMNGKAAIQVLEALRDNAKAVREQIDNLDKNAPDFKEQKAGLESLFDAFQSAHESIIKDTERLDTAIQNLTSTSLQNLRKALGDGRRELLKLSEDELEKADEIRKKMKLVGDEIRLLEGQYVKISDGLKDISNQSDQWLDKAIKQQRDLVGSLQKSDAEYQKNLSILKQLEAEEDRRSGKMSKNEAMATVSNKYANASGLRRAKTAITEVRDKTDSHKVDEIDRYNNALQEIDKRLASISGQFIDIQKGIGNVSNQSDQWLDKAIKQQRELVGSLQKSDASYQQNLDTLKQLEAEEDRRKGKMSLLDARKAVYDDNASASDLRRAKATLTEARDNTPTQYSDSIGDYNRELQEIEKRLEAVSGKAQKATMSWKEMRQVLSAPNKASGEDIKRTMEVIQQKIQQLPAGGKYVADLRRQYTMLEQTLKGTRMSQMALNDILNRSKQGKASLDELRRAYKQLEEELNQVNIKSKEFENKQKSMKELKKNIDKVTGAANKQGGAWQTALRNLTAYVGLFAVFNQLKTYLFDVFRLNAQFAEQLTNIRKVALSTQEEVGKLSKELSKIETRTSVEELNNLAYAGAKLGVTTQNLAGFVRAADQVNVALKEDLGDEALTALAKITEVSGLIDKYGVEDAMLRVGSSIFRLASTSTACSPKIVDFSNRMLALGDAAALSVPDILAIGAAVDSMALEPEVAATAFGKLVVELRKGTSSIEKDLGIAQGSLKKLIEEGKGMEAIQTIFRKMHESKNVFALNSLFKDMGSEDGARLTKTMVTMAEKVDMLDKAVAESNKAFKEGTAVTVEYEMQQETATAYMERAANLFEKQFVTADAASGPVRDLAKAWYEMVDALVHNITFMTEVRMLITLLMASMKLFLNILPSLITVLSTAGLAGAFARLAELTTGLNGKTLSLAKAWDVMVASYNKLSFVKQMGIMGGLIGLAGVLVVKLAQWSASLNQVAAGQRVLNEVQEEGQRRAMEEQESLKRLHRVMHDTTASMDLRLEAMNKLNSAIPNLNAKINSETGAVQENTKAWEENFKRLQDYYELEGARAKLAELGRKKVDAILKLQQKEDAYANTNVDIPTRPVTSGGAVMGGQAQGAIGQAGQRAAAKRERDKAQQEYNDIVAQEDALYKKFGARLNVKGKKVKGKPKVVGGGGTGGGSTGSGSNPNNDEKNIAKDRANTLIANIKAFYEEQMRKYLEWVAQMNADGEKISEGQQKEQMDYLQSQMDRALGKARQSIATLDNGWKKFFQHMDEDVMVYDDETSKQLLESIGKADVEGLHKLFTKLSGDLSRENNKTLAENLGALLDQMFANGSKELREAAEKLLARQREIQKILNEHDYTGAVNRNTRSEFDRLGFLQPAKDIRTDSPEGLDKMNAAFDKLTTKARESITVLYSLNPESKEFQEQFLDFLSVANEGFDFSKLKAQDLKALYLELIKYNDEYIAAEKKRYDEAKKITDFLWKRNERNLAQQDKLRKMENESQMFGKRTNLLSNLGLADLTADPEIELMKARMQAAEDYYAFVERNTKNQQLIDEAERARQEAELAYVNQMATAMKSRLSQMKELVQPIEDFGAAVGQALAEMRYDAESANDAIKSALKSMLESWTKMALNDVNTQMWKAINDAGAKRGKANAQPDIDAARANAKPILPSNEEDPFANFRNIGTVDNPVWVRMVNGVPEGVDGQPKAVPLSPTGKMVQNPDGTYGFSGEVSQGDYENVNEKDFLRHVLGSERSGSVLFTDISEEQEIGEANEQSGVPRAWKKRHPDGTLDEYNQEAADIAGQVGGNVADLATGNISLSDVVSGVGGSVIGELVNTDFSANSNNNDKKEKKERKKRLKEEKKHQRELTREHRKGSEEREKINEKGVKNITKISENAGKEQTKLEEVKQNTTNAIVETGLNTTFQKKQENDAAVVEQSKDTAQAENTFSIVGAIGKCFEFLGPIAGPIAAASVMAILTGLMQWGLNAAFGSKKKNSSSSTKNTKLVSGMLTYDSGNVQDLKPFVADNGEIYWAKEQDKPQSGVNLLTTPTATAINGQRALVAENGPELVIGRETTKAMMMNNPSLLKALVNYDRNYSGRNAARRAFDEGNVSESFGNLSSGASATDGLIADSRAANIALIAAINTLMQRLDKPIHAKIDMYGRGNLYDSMTKANQFMKGKS